MLGPFKVFGNMFMGFLCLGGSLYGKPYVLALDEDSGGAPGCGWSFRGSLTIYTRVYEALPGAGGGLHLSF
jgi:hypothetical protein